MRSFSLLQSIHNGSGAHTTPCSMRSRSPFLVGKLAMARNWPLTSIYAEVKNCGVYPHSLICLHSIVLKGAQTQFHSFKFNMTTLLNKHLKVDIQRQILTACFRLFWVFICMKIGFVVNISERNAASILGDKTYKEGKECRNQERNNSSNS